MTARGNMVGAVMAALVLGGLAAWSAGMPIEGQGPDAVKGGTPQAASPVLVELFTSEGCSSCPPADQLLTRLVKASPIDGAEVIALGFHVDYWDRLGWKDCFSSSAFTDRQNRYAAAWKSDQIFTPQAVVDGRVQVVGSDGARLAQAIEAARTRSRTKVSVRVSTSGGRPQLAFGVGTIPDASLPVDVLLVIAEDGLASDVKAGENANRRLEHAGVVRRIDRIARFSDDKPFTILEDYWIKVDPSWKLGSMRAVVILQEEKTRAVVGVGQATF